MINSNHGRSLSSAATSVCKLVAGMKFYQISRNHGGLRISGDCAEIDILHSLLVDLQLNCSEPGFRMGKYIFCISLNTQDAYDILEFCR